MTPDDIKVGQLVAVSKHLCAEQDKADEIRIDTDRILSLAKSAQEWDAMTEQPDQENVQLPYDLGNNP